jgi:hypothetical protein
MPHSFWTKLEILAIVSEREKESQIEKCRLSV